MQTTSDLQRCSHWTLKIMFLVLGRLKANSFPIEWPEPNPNKVSNYQAEHAKQELLVLQGSRVCRG